MVSRVSLLGGGSGVHSVTLTWSYGDWLKNAITVTAAGSVFDSFPMLLIAISSSIRQALHDTSLKDW